MPKPPSVARIKALSGVVKGFLRKAGKSADNVVMHHTGKIALGGVGLMTASTAAQAYQHRWRKGPDIGKGQTLDYRRNRTGYEFRAPVAEFGRFNAADHPAYATSYHPLYAARAQQQKPDLAIARKIAGKQPFTVYRGTPESATVKHERIHQGIYRAVPSNRNEYLPPETMAGIFRVRRDGKPSPTPLKEAGEAAWGKRWEHETPAYSFSEGRGGWLHQRVARYKYKKAMREAWGRGPTRALRQEIGV